MGRVAETANTLAVAVAATAVGCTLVLELAPSHRGSERSAAPPRRRPSPPARSPPAAPPSPATGRPARTRHSDGARRAGPGRGPPCRVPAGRDDPGHGARRPREPAGQRQLPGRLDQLHRRRGGRLAERDRRPRPDTATGVGLPRAGAASAGEALVTLPAVPPGRAYALEVAAGNGTAHAFSRPFAVTDENRRGAPAAGPPG
ncbi:hypothetical protein O1L55_03880 [Streptomyces albulus]|nr:hypothetical protein [Streptomyces noursei]